MCELHVYQIDGSSIRKLRLSVVHHWISCMFLEELMMQSRSVQDISANHQKIHILYCVYIHVRACAHLLVFGIIIIIITKKKQDVKIRVSRRESI